MKILLTGGSGFIGKSFIIQKKYLYDIHVVVRPDTNVSFFEKVQIPYVVDDRKSSLLDYLSENKPDGIMHFASLFLKDHANADINDLIESNIAFGTRLIEAAVQSETKWFINTGTFWQHFNNEDYNPINLYAATKQAFQDILEYYRNSGHTKITTVKLNDTYGPDDTRPKVMNLWKKYAESGDTLDMSPGDQLMDIVYIDDVVAAYNRVIEIMESNQTYQTSYMVSSGERITLKELADKFSETTGLDLHINWGAKSYREKENMIPWDRGSSIPGWSPEVELEEGFKRTFSRYVR